MRGDQPVTCRETFGDSHAGVRGAQCKQATYTAQCSLSGTFIFQITQKKEKISVLSEGKISDTSEQDLCLLYRPSLGKPESYYCNTNCVSILLRNPGGFKGEQMGCSAC